MTNPDQAPIALTEAAFARLCEAHMQAEEQYLRLIALAGDNLDLPWTPVVQANAKAEGLAIAIAIISGSDTGEVRARTQQRCEDRRGAR